MDEDSASQDHLSKQERQAARQRAATRRRRRRLLLRGLIAGVVLLVPALWLVDRAGSHAIVDAEVVRTRIWRHRPQDGKPHIHTDAILLIQGINEVTLRRADTLEKGQRVRVLVRTGRLTGWPYFVELAEGPAPERVPEPPAVPALAPEEEPSLDLEEEPSVEPDGGGLEGLESDGESG
jgi:hypothetical protein